MSKYKTVGSAGGNLKLLTPSMSKWDSDDCAVIGRFLGLDKMKTKIGFADLLNLKVEEIEGIEQEENTQYPAVEEGDEASLMVNGSFMNNFTKLVDKYGDVIMLPDGSVKVEDGEIVKTLPIGTILRVARKGTYDSPYRNDCNNIVIEILEESEKEALDV